MLVPASIRRVLEDKLRADIAAARGAHAASLPQGPWPDTMPIGQAGLGADSLELLTLAGAVNEMFHIHDTGIEDALLARRSFGGWVDLIQQSWKTSSRRISFRTSGSTGKPKRCTHNMRDLVAEADEHARRLRPNRILAAVPSHHIYGFIFSVLLPALAGCEVIDIRTMLPPRFLPGDLLVSFPDHWQYLAASLNHLPFVTGVTSTAPMPTALARDLHARLLPRLIEIYGSSETGGVGWRDDPDAPFALLDIWSVREAPANDGILQVTGPSGNHAETPDRVAMAGPRSFRVRGRVDGAVQVGGINVFPARVAATLQRHPLVAHARVRLAAPECGRLKALIVPNDPAINQNELRQQLEDWIMQHVQGPERPRSLTIAPEIPIGNLGKECDWTETA